MFLLLIGFVRFIRFNRLYTKPYPNPTVFIKLYPFGLYGIFQNQTILSILVRFGSVRFDFTILNNPNYNEFTRTCVLQGIYQARVFHYDEFTRTIS